MLFIKNIIQNNNSNNASRSGCGSCGSCTKDAGATQNQQVFGEKQQNQRSNKGC